MNQWLSINNLLVLGHRGASAYAPENTLRAFRLARTQGAAGIEFDIQLSKDGVPVVIHDQTVDRTTNGQGAVASFSCADLQQLDAGNGAIIPTLDAVFEEMGSDFLYNVEIKAEPLRVSECVAAVIDCIDRHTIHDQICISSFEHNIMQMAQSSVSRQIALGMLHAPQSPPFPDWFRGEAAHPHYTMVNEAYMAWAKAWGWIVNVWTVDSAEEAQRLQQLGVSTVISNKPDLIQTAISP